MSIPGLLIAYARSNQDSLSTKTISRVSVDSSSRADPSNPIRKRVIALPYSKTKSNRPIALVHVQQPSLSHGRERLLL